MSTSGVQPTAFSIAFAKVGRYLLDLNHRQGGPKARLLMRFGFTPGDPARLLEALVRHPENGRLIGASLTPLGETKLAYEGRLDTPDGRPLMLRTIWRIRPDGTAEFVTATPIKRQG